MEKFNKSFTTPDGEVRENLTDAELEAMFSTAKRLDELPSSLQAKLLNPELIDEENPEWTEADFAQAKPAQEVLPQIFNKKLAEKILHPKSIRV